MTYEPNVEREAPSGRPPARYDRTKRLFDVTSAVVVGVLLSPLLVAIALVVRLRIGAPVLFRQTRTGLRDRSFDLVKFRTMTEARGPDGTLLPDADRLTPLGRFLRSTSLDELPELWNVLRGDMSLVGPRPLLPEYLPRYSDTQRRRHDVRPGITGWAQVNGRNAVDWPERLAMDVWYVENRSWRLDLTILVRTVLAVVRREGVSAPNEATMRPFLGEQRDDDDRAP